MHRVRLPALCRTAVALACGGDAFTSCGHVSLAAADGSVYRWPTSGLRRAWTPDGRWVAFALGYSARNRTGLVRLMGED